MHRFSGDHSGEDQDGPHGEVDSAGNDHIRHSDTEDGQDRGILNDLTLIGPTGKGGRRQSAEDYINEEQYQQNLERLDLEDSRDPADAPALLIRAGRGHRGLAAQFGYRGSDGATACGVCGGVLAGGVLSAHGLAPFFESRAPVIAPTSSSTVVSLA